MADDTEAEDAEAPEGEDGEEGGGKKKKPKLMMLGLFIGLPVLVLALGGGAAFMLLTGGKEEAGHEVADAGGHGEEGGHGASGDGHGGEHAAAAAEDVVFYELPDLLVNIRNDEGRASYLKLKLTLEVDSEETVHAIEPAMPRVVDRFQSFLRELRVEDLNGSLGSYRLRLELLRRVNLAVAPHEVQAVLIEEMLIQ